MKYPARAASLPLTAYLLAGGESRRMGRDKALLEFGGKPLGEHVASIVAKACGPVTVVGDPARHGVIGQALGCAVIADLHPKIGPLGGIEAALAASPTPWVLVAACDMPGLTEEFLATLAEEGARLEALAREGKDEAPDALLPIPPGGPANPLCALYHQRLLPRLRQAIDAGDYKVTRALSGTRLRLLPVDDAAPLRGANTPEEWEALQRELAEQKAKVATGDA